MTTNLYLGNGDCADCCDEVKHLTIDFLLSEDASYVFREMIPCPPGKRVVVLMGRIESRHECELAIRNGNSANWGDTPQLLDTTSFPDGSYLLPATTTNQAHFRTGAGRGLWFWGTTWIATTEPRTITGYLKYCLLDAVGLGNPLWGDIQGDCFVSPVLIEWPVVTGAELYQLERRQIVGGVAGAWAVVYSGSNPFYEDTLDGGFYEYRFMAFNEDDHSDYSPGLSFIVKPSFAITLTCPESICSIYWGEVSGAYQFKVYRDDILIATTSYQGVADPITRDAVYIYRVEAYITPTCFGVATHTINLNEPCQQPVIVDFIVNRNGFDISLSWGSSTATSYEVYRDDVLMFTTDNSYRYFDERVAGLNSYTYTLKALTALPDCFAAESQTIEVPACEDSASVPAPSIEYFDSSQENGTVLLSWFASEAYISELYRNGVLIAQISGNNAQSYADAAPNGVYEYKVICYQTDICFVDASSTIEVVDLSFHELPNNLSACDTMIFWDYAKGLTLSGFEIISQGEYHEKLIYDEFGQPITLVDINTAPNVYNGQTWTNIDTLTVCELDFFPTWVISHVVFGMINNQLAARFFFAPDTTGQQVNVFSHQSSKGDIFMCLNPGAGNSPTSPTSRVITNPTGGLIPNNHINGVYPIDYVVNMPPNAQGNIWLSFQIKTVLDPQNYPLKPNRASIGRFNLNSHQTFGYGVKLSSLNLTDLKYKQMGDITIIGGYVNKQQLLSSSLYYATLDSVGWY